MLCLTLRQRSLHRQHNMDSSVTSRYLWFFCRSRRNDLGSQDREVIKETEMFRWLKGTNSALEVTHRDISVVHDILPTKSVALISEYAVDDLSSGSNQYCDQKKLIIEHTDVSHMADSIRALHSRASAEVFESPIKSKISA